MLRTVRMKQWRDKTAVLGARLGGVARHGMRGGPGDEQIDILGLTPCSLRHPPREDQGIAIAYVDSPCCDPEMRSPDTLTRGLPASKPNRSPSPLSKCLLSGLCTVDLSVRPDTELAHGTRRHC